MVNKNLNNGVSLLTVTLRSQDVRKQKIDTRYCTCFFFAGHFKIEYSDTDTGGLL